MQSFKITLITFQIQRTQNQKVAKIYKYLQNLLLNWGMDTEHFQEDVSSDALFVSYSYLERYSSDSRTCI